MEQGPGGSISSDLTAMKNILPHPARLDLPGEPVELVDEAVGFCLTLGRALHVHGVPAHRLEEALAMLAERLGMAGDFFVTPTLILASFGRGRDQQTRLVRVGSGVVDLGRLADLEAIMDAVASGQLAPAEAEARVHAVLAAPARIGVAATAAASALACGAAARLFGGGLPEIGAAGLLGAMIAILGAQLETRRDAARLLCFIAAAAAAFGAAAWSRLAGPLDAPVATLGGLIVLVPGLTLTIAINELATRNLVAGTARMMAAAMDLLALGFGIALGGRLGALLPGEAIVASATALPAWTLHLAALVAPLAFLALFRARLRDAPWIVLAGVLSFNAARLGSDALGAELGGMIGATTAGVVANAVARWRGRPAAIVLVPALMMLVPGSLGFRSVASLVAHDVVGGLAAAFTTILVATGIVMGMLVAQVILPARRPL